MITRPYEQITRKLPKAAWVLVVVLMIASATHLLRSAWKADQTLAINLALAVFIICLIFGLGTQRTDPTTAAKQRYIPLSSLPIILLAIWAANARLFGKFDVSAVFFHLQHSLVYDGVRDDIVEFVAYLMFALILIACLSFLARRDRRVVLIERIFAVLILIANPITAYTYDRVINPQRSSVDLVEAYQAAQPPNTHTAPKNLLLIYLESLEATFSEDAFGDVYADLNALSADGIQLNGIAQVEDTGWTMAGLVASQCGVPLLSYGLIMKNRMKNIREFLPNADCLATRLSNAGYQTQFLGGAPLNFAGKGKFLKAHGYQKAVGLDEIPQEQRGAVGKWGIYDDQLFDMAMVELESLSDADAPYLFSILTLGAHAPVGYPAPICNSTVENAQQMDSTLLSVACTAKLTRSFLTEARSRGFLENTVIILLSDHLSHKNSQTQTLNQYTRENFALILGADQTPAEITKPASMMDVYPTILDSLGLQPAGGKAGLGVSLLGSKPTLLEEHGEKALNLAIRSDTALREQLWDLRDSRPEPQENREVPR